MEDDQVREVMVGCGTAAPMIEELRRMADELEGGEDCSWIVAGNGVDAPALEMRFTIETGEDDWDVPLVDYGGHGG